MSLDVVEASETMRRLTLGEVQVLLAAEAIRSIVAPSPLSALPGAPAWILGYTPADSSYVPVVDLAFFYGQSQRATHWLALEPKRGWPHWFLAVEDIARLDTQKATECEPQNRLLAQRALALDAQSMDCLAKTALLALPEQSIAI